ncbi:MAG: fibronectin type III domain-containing protein, partial [bacterium]
GTPEPGQFETATRITEDFNLCGALGAEWTFFDPQAAGSASSFWLEGAGTTDAHLVLSVPGGSVHNAWSNPAQMPARMRHSLRDTDFAHEFWWDSVPVANSQDQGVLYEQDDANFVRVDFYSNASGLFVFGEQIAGSPVGGGFNIQVVGSPSRLGLRVSRTADTWTVYYSTDNGITWLPTPGIEGPLAVNTLGLYVGNAGTSPPTFDAHVDWIANSADAPIIGEDGEIAGSIKYTLTLSTQGTGTGVVAATPAGNLVGSNPSQYEYWCEPTIQVEAVPDACSVFVGWSGSISGTTNPVSVDLTSDLTLTAIFDLDSQIPVVGPVSVETFGTTARVAFATDLPATMNLAYGLDATVSLGTFFGSGPELDHEFVLTDLTPLTIYHYAINGSDGCGNTVASVTGTFDTGVLVPWTSEDFNHPNLDQGLWNLAAAARPGQLWVAGAGSGDALFNWVQTGGESLSPLAVPPLAPLVQFISDADMDVEVSLTDVFNQVGVARGFEASNSAGDWVRYFAEHSPVSGDVEVRTVSRIGGSTVEIGSPVSIWVAGSGDLEGLKLRIGRDVLTDIWQFSYSTDGVNFSTPTSGTADLIIDAAGPFVAGTGLGPADAVSLQVDYLFDVPNPIVPEDGGSPLDLTAPWIYAVEAIASGETTLHVDWGTEEVAVGWIEYGTDPALLDTITPDLSPADLTQEYTLTELQPATTYYLRVGARDQEAVPNESASAVYSATTLPIGSGQPPVISVWNAVQVENEYHRSFGELGTTQKWLNLQGRIEGLGVGPSVTSEYRLNPQLGGAWNDLKLGEGDIDNGWYPYDPNSRLYQDGDFCIEIDSAPDVNDYNSDDFGAVPGSNLVEVHAVDDEGLETFVNIRFEWDDSPVWPGTYSPDFAAVPPGGSLDGIVQLVDGEWAVGTNQITGLPALQNVDEGYDRLFMVGDPSWVDYDLAFNVTVHHINVPRAYALGSNVAAIGIGLRWNGHELHPWNPKRPRDVWHNTGAFIQYRWGINGSNPTERWKLWHNDPAYIDSSGEEIGVSNQASESVSVPALPLDTPFNIVGSTRTRVDGQSVYMLYAWPEGTLRPDDPIAVIAVPEYGFNRPPGNAAPRNGGALLLAHHMKSSFDSVEATPYPDPSLLYHDDFEIYSLDESDPAFYTPAPWEFTGLTPTEDAGWSACFHAGSPLLPESGGHLEHNRELLPVLRNNTCLGLVLFHNNSSSPYHATYRGPGSELWGNYEFSGRFNLGNEIELAAPMFLIQDPVVPGVGGSHYRFGKIDGAQRAKLQRVEVTASGSEVAVTLLVADHIPDQASSVHKWSKFRIQALDDLPSGGTLIRVKAWRDDEVEPSGWIEYLDSSPSAFTRGSMGFWGKANGERFLDDIRVKQL